MQISVENVNTLERKMTVSVPSAKIDEATEKRLEKISRTAKIDGFRPGKIPKDVIRKQFGLGAQIEALNEVIHESLYNALKEKELHMVGDPQLNIGEQYQKGKDFAYTAVFEVFPQVTLLPFSDLIVEKMVSEVTDEDLAKTLEGMQKQQTKWTVVERAVKDGDRATIDFVGTTDGVEFPGGKGTMPLVIGSKATIPGFEEGIIGAKKGETVTVNVTFPENYGSKDLAGKAAKFVITVNSIEEPALPELNDEFAKSFGVADGGIEKLRAEVKETLQKQVSQQIRQALKADVMKKLAEAYKTLDVPKVLISAETEQLKKQAEQQFAQFQGAKMPEFTTEMFAERAKERVILGLVVNEIVKRDKIKADPAKMRQLIEEIAERFDDPARIVHWYYEQKDRMAEMESLAMEEQIVERIVKDATVVEKPIKAAELLSLGGA
ncbi:MAG TPA: trigger factor [Gammaproteobacteria bacterium]|nr:trigger factor [Gammaproteobacteria bacterium]